MSSSGHERAWEAPVAATLSIRSTANAVGSGGDMFFRQDFYSRPGAAPTAPVAGVGGLPMSETIKAPDADQRSWEAPAVTTVAI